MRKSLSLCFMWMTCLTASLAGAAEFHVSPKGDDGAAGDAAAPFKTIRRAQEAVRKSRVDHPAEPATVRFAAGVHTLEAPFEVTAAESGVEQAPTTYAAEEGADVVLSGGLRLTGWKVENDRWSLELPDKNWTFTQLFVNGEGRHRPRLPQDGYFEIADDMSPSAAFKGRGSDRFQFRGRDIRQDWHDLNRVEVVAAHIWAMSRLPIREVDAEKKIVTFAGATPSAEHWGKLVKGARYFVENVKEAAQPGDFYVDQPAGVVLYFPRPGETPENTTIIAPRLPSLLNVRGEAGRPVHHVVFEGITFAHSNWTTPPAGHSVPQAEFDISGAVNLQWARDCAIEDCKITSIGHYGVDVGAGCRRVSILRCELTDLGAGGIKIGTPSVPPKGMEDEALTREISVADNRIAHGGRLHPAAIGVWLGQTPNNKILHNEIFDFYYTGISMGWTWGYGPALAQNNEIGWNHIHAIGQRVLSDMGGIYTLGEARGTTLHHNLIHDVDAFDYGGWGVYPDEGTSHMLIENNVVYDTKTGSFHQHYGRENIVRNNIFAFSRKWQLQRTREEDHQSFTFERNIVLWKTGPLLGSNWKNNHFTFDHNLYWKIGVKTPDFAEMSFKEWKAKGQDEHSIIADPKFVDAEHRDFRLQPDSPASKIGFQPIDLSDVGPRDGRKAADKVSPGFPIPKPEKD